MSVVWLDTPCHATGGHPGLRVGAERDLSTDSWTVMAKLRNSSGVYALRKTVRNPPSIDDINDVAESLIATWHLTELVWP